MNLFTSPRLFLARVRSEVRQDPVRDWLVILILAVLAFVSIVVWNIWAFDTVAHGGIIGPDTRGAQSGLDKSSINSIHDVFTKRAAEVSKYITGVYRYADPSQ